MPAQRHKVHNSVFRVLLGYSPPIPREKRGAREQQRFSPAIFQYLGGKAVPDDGEFCDVAIPTDKPGDGFVGAYFPPVAVVSLAGSSSNVEQTLPAVRNPPAQQRVYPFGCGAGAVFVPPVNGRPALNDQVCHAYCIVRSKGYQGVQPVREPGAWHAGQPVERLCNTAVMQPGPIAPGSDGQVLVDVYVLGGPPAGFIDQMHDSLAGEVISHIMVRSCNGCDPHSLTLLLYVLCLPALEDSAHCDVFPKSEGNEKPRSLLPP